MVGVRAGDATDKFAFRIDEAIYDVNSARIARAEAGTRILWFKVAATGATYIENFIALDLRISVNGRASAAFRYGVATISEGETKVVDAYFKVPAATTALDFIFPTSANTRFHAELADSVLAKDIP